MIQHVSLGLVALSGFFIGYDLATDKPGFLVGIWVLSLVMNVLAVTMVMRPKLTN